MQQGPDIKAKSSFNLFQWFRIDLKSVLFFVSWKLLFNLLLALNTKLAFKSILWQKEQFWRVVSTWLPLCLYERLWSTSRPSPGNQSSNRKLPTVNAALFNKAAAKNTRVRAGNVGHRCFVHRNMCKDRLHESYVTVRMIECDMEIERERCI